MSGVLAFRYPASPPPPPLLPGRHLPIFQGSFSKYTLVSVTKVFMLKIVFTTVSFNTKFSVIRFIRFDFTQIDT